MAAPTPADVWESQWLPHRPSAGDFAQRVRRMNRPAALDHRLIEANCSALKNTIVIDMDEPDSLARVFETHRGVPAPTYTAENKENGHLHAGWRFRSSVCVTDNGRPGPMNFLGRTERGLREALGGDVSYVGFLTKNPLHPEWVVNWHHHEDRDLGDIAAGLRYLPPRPAKQAELAAGFGRNCELFAQTRVPAYRLRRTWTDTPDRFDAAVFELAWLINADTFAKPLHRTEVGHLAHSISRWSWRHIDPDPHVFIQIQTRRAIKGTQAAAAQRRIDRTNARKVLAMAAETPKRRAITAKAAADLIGCSPRTVQRIQAEPRTQYDARVKERRELVLSLKEDQGMTYRQIADALNLSVSNVGYILHTARKARIPQRMARKAS